MRFAVCIVAAAPLRKENAHRSEMISQILLGEFAEIVQEEKDFIRIKCLFDGYEGWCQKSQLDFIDEIPDSHIFYQTADKLASINGQPVTISIATPYHQDKIKATRHELVFEAQQLIDATKHSFTQENISAIAHAFLNVPYLWGGRSSFGIDCSGYVQQVFKFFNMQLPRDAYQQAECGEPIGFLQETKCGDLVFFDNAEGRIVHVGILLNAATIIHASGNVRVDKIDHAGIIHSSTGERTHHLRIIKRMP